jgi:hypothetical protein
VPELNAASRCFQRLEVRLGDSQQNIDVAVRPAAEVFQPGLHVDHGHDVSLMQLTQEMPHRGMRTAHSPFAGVIDRTHEQEGEPISHRYSKLLGDISRRDRQPHRSSPLCIGVFLKNTSLKRFASRSRFSRCTDSYSQVWIAVSVDRPYFVSAVCQLSG